ncbi:LOW QUALITY PROTEIN: nicotinate phosphoribosyltransferase [Aegotheles albertisi]
MGTSQEDLGDRDNPLGDPLNVTYLCSVLLATIEDVFFDYLATLDTSEVTVSAAPEGSVVYARVPFLQVKGPLLVVQLLETTLLCLVNYASLVATNAARFRLLAGPDMKLMEIGLRRAQGPDGASASKYSYIGGHPFMDLMALKEEPSPSAGQELVVHILGQLGETSKVVPTTVEPLHRTYFRDGQVCEQLPSLTEVRNHVQMSLNLLSPAHRRFHQPEPYLVAVTERLHHLLLKLQQGNQ